MVTNSSLTANDFSYFIPIATAMKRKKSFAPAIKQLFSVISLILKSLHRMKTISYDVRSI